MENQQLDLGRVQDVSVESFGEPGQRTFRVLARTSEGRVSLWLEKEQVVMLGSAISELLERVAGDEGRDPEVATSSSFVGDLEVRAGSLSVGFDVNSRGFTLEAGEFVSPVPLGGILFTVTRDQFEHMGDQIETIVSASRPRCILCGTPLSEEPHFCPDSNGHAKVTRSS